jgi:hypothetical protein
MSASREPRENLANADRRMRGPLLSGTHLPSTWVVGQSRQPAAGTPLAGHAIGVASRINSLAIGLGRFQGVRSLRDD